MELITLKFMKTDVSKAFVKSSFLNYSLFFEKYGLKSNIDIKASKL